MAETNGLSEDVKAKIWAHWGKGAPMIFISRDVSRAPTSVFSFLRYHGGIQPRSRYRRSDSLTLAKREEYSRGLAAGNTLRSIANDLGRSPSVAPGKVRGDGGHLGHTMRNT